METTYEEMIEALPAEYRPKFKEGDIVVLREVIPSVGFLPEQIVKADAVVPFRIQYALLDRLATDREGEPGYGHSYRRERVFPSLKGRDTIDFLQGWLCLWAERKEEVLAAYRRSLAALEGL